MIEILLGTLIGTFILQTASVWYKLGKLEKSIKNSSCPFGKCPLWERAKIEAAPLREKEEENVANHS